MNINKLKNGDVVVLTSNTTNKTLNGEIGVRSDEHYLTVTDASLDRTIKCMYYYGGEYKVVSIPSECLILTPHDSPM